jgi:ribulose-phosphate 3-epimerase
MNFDYPVLAPSILAANFTRLGSDINECLEAGINWIHCDIMDGHFVPNISYGPSIVGDARKFAEDAFFDVHLMIEHPDHFIEDFADAGSDLITVHYEACPHLHRTIQNIKQQGCMAGVAINPATDIQVLQPILEYVDLVLIMSVNPGFGGQSFIESTHKKIKSLVVLRNELQLNFLIEVDGGVSTKNISELAANGVDVLVAGSSVFKTEDRRKRIHELSKLAKTGSKTII